MTFNQMMKKVLQQALLRSIDEAYRFTNTSEAQLRALEVMFNGGFFTADNGATHGSDKNINRMTAKALCRKGYIDAQEDLYVINDNGRDILCAASTIIDELKKRLKP